MAPPNKIRGSLPPPWMFRQGAVYWMGDAQLRTQLPLLYKALGFYVKVYFALRPKADKLPFGKYLLYGIHSVEKRRPAQGFHVVQIGDYQVCLDLLDARFIQVVHDLTRQKSSHPLQYFIGSGDTLIDVGANQGSYSVVASHLVGATGQVISFEPQPRLAYALRKTLANAPASFEVHDIALGERTAESNFLIPESYSGMAGVSPDFSGRHEHTKITVSMQTADDFFDGRSIGGDVLIKLDIEGGELNFLRGAWDFIGRSRPRLLMELNPEAARASGTDIETLVREVMDLGYTSYAYLDEWPSVRTLPDLEYTSLTDIVLLMPEHQ